MDPEALALLNLDDYFERIGYCDPPSANRATLQAIHAAHATHIPFENIDVVQGVPIRLDVESLQAKLVRQRRGGYCFEQNMLLAAVLEKLGFRIRRLQARVRWGASCILPRTHMAIDVEVDGDPWLADVGFGGWGLIEPIPLKAGESQQFAWPYRLRQEDEHWWALQAPQDDAWQDLYAFTREAYLPVDYEPANYYVSTQPDSIFLKGLIAQLPTPEMRYMLRGRELIVADRKGTTVRQLDDNELKRVLAQRFGLSLPAGMALPV